MRPRGHVVVLGTAGSGKTTIAALRAGYLADPVTEHAGATLLVTYNSSLVEYLKVIGRDELANVTVENLHKFVRGYLNSRGLMRPIVEGAPQKACVKSAIKDAGLLRLAAAHGIAAPALAEMLSHEFSVIFRLGLSRDEYIAPNLYVRSTRLDESIGPGRVYDALEEYVAKRNVKQPTYDWDDILLAGWEAIQDDAGPRRYRHIVIDEGQDFPPVSLRMLIEAVQPGGSVTFFGDVAQQIYGRETNWRAAGFEVDEPEIFEENLRNTPQIARLGVAISKMPYYRDVPDIIEPTMPMDEGPLPTLVRYASEADEITAVVGLAREAVRTQHVAIICPNHTLQDRIVTALRANKDTKMKVRVVDKKLKWPRVPRIFVATYHNAKGLEFDSVILPFVSSEHSPSHWLEELYGNGAAETYAGSLLYVGVTRARQRLIITYAGEISALLPGDAGAAAPLYTRARQ